MKKYTFEIIITEGNDEFWEDLISREVTGCNEVTSIVKDCIDIDGLDVEIKLVEFKDR